MLCDENMLVPDAQQPPADQDNDRGDNGDPCPEDEEYFDRPDAATMEEAISRFMDGLEAQELCGNNPCYACIYQYVLSTNKYKLVCTLFVL